MSATVDRTSPQLSPRVIANEGCSSAASPRVDHSHFGQSTIAKAEAPSFAAPISVHSAPLLNVGDANIPSFNLDAIAQASGEKRTELVRDFGDGLQAMGFIAVNAPQALMTLIPKVNAQMKWYYSRSREDKMRDWHDNNGQTGFAPQGNETAAGAKKPDIKETFFIPPNLKKWPKVTPECEAVLLSFQEKMGDEKYAETKLAWQKVNEGEEPSAEFEAFQTSLPPEDLFQITKAWRQEKKYADFKEVMTAYQQEMTKVSSLLMGIVSEYLGEVTEPVAKSMEDATNLLRLAHYPAAKPEDDPEAVRSAAHYDLNALTVMPRSEVPGLQLYKHEKWLSVNAPEGHLIVNTGEQLELKTAGFFKATLHQVLNPMGDYSRMARFASIFFASWSNEFSLKPFDSCLEKMTAGMTPEEAEAYAKKFPNVNVEENLLSRLIEMGSIPNPDAALVAALHDKGLLKAPPEKLVAQYPFLAKASVAV